MSCPVHEKQSDPNMAKKANSPARRRPLPVMGVCGDSGPSSTLTAVLFEAVSAHSARGLRFRREGGRPRG